MRKAMESAGFRVVPLEYYDEDGVFHAVDWDPEDGKVNRSLRFDSRNANGQIGYTSLIVDGIRP
jgi:predicted SAM-dependent methyltransferase